MRVEAAMGGVEAAARHRKLTEAAEQFEGMFLQQMLKTKTVDGEALDAENGGGMMQDFGAEFMAKAVAHAGGLGIARHVVAQVEKTSAAASAKKISVQG